MEVMVAQEGLTMSSYIPSKQYYILDGATALKEKKYKEYGLLVGLWYCRIRVYDDKKVTEIYLSDETDKLQIVGIEENKANYYWVDINDGCKIYRDDGYTYVYVEEGLFREQDKRIYTGEPVDQWNLPDIVYVAYELIYNCEALSEYMYDLNYNIKNISVKEIQDLIKEINNTDKTKINISKIKELLCQNPPKIR